MGQGQERGEGFNFMRYTGPKDRLSRAEGFDLFGKGAKLTRLAVVPGMHGQRRYRGKLSEYARQLREKQKAKRMYGLTEKQFKSYVTRAQTSNKNDFVHFLERRLDNVVYRLGLAPTRPAARQLVSHRHILVDGKKLNIASYLVREGQTIALDSKAQGIAEIAELMSKSPENLPAWLDRKVSVGKVLRLPTQEDILEPISTQDIIEFYSR